MSKTPVCDLHKKEWRDGFGHFSEWVPVSVASVLETEHAEMAELLQLALATDHMDEDDPVFVHSRDRIRALLAKINKE